MLINKLMVVYMQNHLIADSEQAVASKVRHVYTLNSASLSTSSAGQGLITIYPRAIISRYSVVVPMFPQNQSESMTIRST